MNLELELSVSGGGKSNIEDFTGRHHRPELGRWHRSDPDGVSDLCAQCRLDMSKQQHAGHDRMAGKVAGKRRVVGGNPHRADFISLRAAAAGWVARRAISCLLTPV